MSAPFAGAEARLLPDGRRLHLHHGPIDIVAEAFAPEAVRARAYAQAAQRFATVLEELCTELPELRRPAAPSAFRGAVARRMQAAVLPHAGVFVTPMAAVAGAVADEVLAAMVAGLPVARAYVNDGGDVALHLAPGESIAAAIAAENVGFREAGRVRIGADSPVRGIATSGWPGRSHSLGIADAVTVLAPTAAAADVAATLIANAVDLPGHPTIRRRPAVELSPDSDLGDRPVTVAVGALTSGETARALDAGLAMAEDMRARGLIEGAALFLGDDSRATGLPAPLPAHEGT